MAATIEHSGVVERTDGAVVRVRFVAGSACASCRAREACGMGESQEKIVDVATPEAASFAAGDPVTVSVSRNAGLRAVFVAYVGAFVVLVASIVAALELFGWQEGAAVLAGLLALTLYYLALWLFRGRIERNIHFTITKR